MNKSSTIAPLIAAACACATPAPTAPAPAVARARPTNVPAKAVRPQTDGMTPVQRGDRPWWHSLSPGLYRRGAGVAVMATGRSDDHHHPAEGFLQAKVRARLAVRKAASRVAFQGSMPEPYLEDLFITAERAFVALYRLDVPGNVTLPDSVAAWVIPDSFRGLGRRRVGRHIFEDASHLFLECDVEGPIANPDWGQTRASAQWIPARRNR